MTRVKLSSLSESDDTFPSLQALSDLNYLFDGFLDYLWSRKFYQWVMPNALTRVLDSIPSAVMHQLQHCLPGVSPGRRCSGYVVTPGITFHYEILLGELDVRAGAFLTHGKASSIPAIFSWGDSISPDGFLPSILLFLVIIVAVTIVAMVILVVVVVGEGEHHEVRAKVARERLLVSPPIRRKYRASVAFATGCRRINKSRRDSEEEEPEDQGRKSQDDPLVSLVQGLVTPSKTTVNASGEEQVEDISPTTLEAAKTLSRVASQKPKSIDKGRRYKRRKETKGKKVVTSLDFQEEVSTGYAEGVNTGSIKVSTVSGKVSTVSGQVSTDSIKKSIPSPDKGQREGKAPMIIEEAPKKTKEQILQEEASLAEAIRLDTLEKEEEAKQVHLDSLLAQRIAEEEELNEQQKQRRGLN
ncbi:hypothetical protein Tco_0399663 [Tanacetum coccineum]